MCEIYTASVHPSTDRPVLLQARPCSSLSLWLLLALAWHLCDHVLTQYQNLDGLQTSFLLIVLGSAVSDQGVGRCLGKVCLRTGDGGNATSSGIFKNKNTHTIASHHPLKVTPSTNYSSPRGLGFQHGKQMQAIFLLRILWLVRPRDAAQRLSRQGAKWTVVSQSPVRPASGADPGHAGQPGQASVISSPALLQTQNLPWGEQRAQSYRENRGRQDQGWLS